MEKEIWRPIKGYEGLYEVSSYGRVRSLGRLVTYPNGSKRFYEERLLSLKKGNRGYLTCVLYKNSKRKTFNVHRLVAQAFIQNPDNLPQVNHKDENKANNCVFVNKDGSVDLNKSNLEWCDSKYNQNYGTRNKRMAEKLSKPVLQLDKETNEIVDEYSSAREVERKLNIDNGSISKCCNGKYKTAGGYKWRYKE